MKIKRSQLISLITELMSSDISAILTEIDKLKRQRIFGTAPESKPFKEKSEEEVARDKALQDLLDQADPTKEEIVDVVPITKSPRSTSMYSDPIDQILDTALHRAAMTGERSETKIGLILQSEASRLGIKLINTREWWRVISLRNLKGIVRGLLNKMGGGDYLAGEILQEVADGHDYSDFIAGEGVVTQLGKRRVAELEAAYDSVFGNNRALLEALIDSVEDRPTSGKPLKRSFLFKLGAIIYSQPQTTNITPAAEKYYGHRF